MHFRTLCLTSAIALTASAAAAEMSFNRIASFATPDNMAEGEDRDRVTSAEIIYATEDGNTLVYTDSPLGVIGRIDITDPANPKPLGNVSVDGEPTSVYVHGTTIFAGVNTSESYTDPSGKLVMIDATSGELLGECDLGGQPDSTAMAKDGSFVTVAIENERDEDLGDGRVPQMPAGYVAILDVVDGVADCDSLVKADVTGLAEIAPEDPEPEFVDVNGAGEIVVTLQENNHIVVLDKSGEVLSHFSAGSVDLTGIDATDERGALLFTENQEGRVREPDGVQWIDDEHFAIANEGDMDGGSRGFTVFHKDGTEVFESGTDFEQAVIRAGHYPDKRSDAKGVEPEGMEFASFGDTPFLFLLAERASMVGVYDMTDPAAPVLTQLLPSGIAPEGAVAIPQRNLFVTANEEDLVEDGGVRAHVMIYEYAEGEAQYPTLTSEGADELIGWGAISGMVAGDDGMIYAVNDSFYGYQPRIFTIDPSQSPARIVAATDVTRAGRNAQKLDLEGITTDGEGGFWLASEGRTDRLVPHALYHVTAEGEIEEEVSLPAELLAVETRFGFEGVTMIDGTLWMAVQREWGDDPEDHVKLVSYTPETGEWGAVLYPKATPETGWVGLSEITAHGDHVYVVERDNQIGANAVTKKIYRIALSEMQPAALGGELPVVGKEEVRDLIPDLKGWGGYVVDKVEGLAITEDGTVYVSTDNDGVDDSSGETFFWSFDLE
ncbi:esterase-like activity of phytase family protein [Salipiger bermudensis]|uniref:esterase-like activity of phytase family protein n=1 Tax=Salipiger bermudensis TaxID=344736 RepID=UPI001CD46CBA|nr:esterase-like activity of phytase family protein [Salipiger bermudensis]MCA0962694.1 esterase-like activity of phytase family protein [Salipiger bermudensis]